MEALVLYCGDEPLREFPLGAAPVEVGRAAGCDIVVHDPDVAERHLLIRPLRDSIRVHDLAGAARPHKLAVNDRLRVGRYHTIVRVADAAPRPRRSTPRTDPVSLLSRAPQPLVLLIGTGGDARRVQLEDSPVSVGNGPDNDLVVVDPTVSRYHCRIDPLPDGTVRVCDHGSRNGTWVDGVRVTVGRAGPGSRVRIGRTDLSVVPRGHRGDARDTGFVAASPAMLGVLGHVERMAQLRWPVLVQAESGAGKEGVARALHDRGPRASGPFVAINAGGLPQSLVESELFGHEKGAFTGAAGARRGVFEQADGGTLFLDEVGELPLDLQARLLRVLERWEVRRVGSELTIAVDVRLVCATHRDLKAMADEGQFRADLYYRMARLVVDIPPLRARPEDVVPLVRHFLQEIRRELGDRILSDDALARLLTYDWPGNVRELRNVLSAAAATTPSRIIQSADIERVLTRLSGRVPPSPIEDAGCRALYSVVETHGGNISAAARTLGIPRSTLRDRIKGLVDAKPARQRKAVQEMEWGTDETGS